MEEPPVEFLDHVQSLRSYAQQNLSEADTRVYLIEPVLRILGYTTPEDVRREVPVRATRELVDFELYAGGKAQAIIEAKAVRLPVTDAAAAQCVQYASVLGVRWCLVTNGVTWAIYNAHAAGPLSEKRVATFRLDGTEEEISDAWDVLKLFRRDSLASADPPSRLLAERVVADELANRDSQAVQALQQAVQKRLNQEISRDAVVEIVGKLMGRARGAAPAGANGLGSVAAANGAASEATGVQMSEPLPGSSRKRNIPLKPDGTRVTIADLVEAGLLRTGDVLSVRIADTEAHGTVVPTGIEVNGKVYPHPSTAIKAIRNASFDGWIYWRTMDGRTLSAVRDEFLRSLATA